MPYVARNPDGSIYGRWATQQWDGQEYVQDGHPDLETLPDMKAIRAEAVANIRVTTASGNVFDGDEMAQARMARAITAMDPLDTTAWVLADNAIAIVGRDELREALRLAGAEQTRLWIIPYQTEG